MINTLSHTHRLSDDKLRFATKKRQRKLLCFVSQSIVQLCSAQKMAVGCNSKLTPLPKWQIFKLSFANCSQPVAPDFTRLGRIWHFRCKHVNVSSCQNSPRHCPNKLAGISGFLLDIFSTAQKHGHKVESDNTVNEFFSKPLHSPWLQRRISHLKTFLKFLLQYLRFARSLDSGVASFDMMTHWRVYTGSVKFSPAGWSLASCADALGSSFKFLPHERLLKRAATSVRPDWPIIARLPFFVKLDFDLLFIWGTKWRTSECNISYYDQREVIVQFVEKKSDVFVNLPTGYGKSLLYQVLGSAVDIFRQHACSHRAAT